MALNPRRQPMHFTSHCRSHFTADALSEERKASLMNDFSREDFVQTVISQQPLTILLNDPLTLHVQDGFGQNMVLSRSPHFSHGADPPTVAISPTLS